MRVGTTIGARTDRIVHATHMLDKVRERIQTAASVLDAQRPNLAPTDYAALDAAIASELRRHAVLRAAVDAEINAALCEVVR